MMIPEPDNPDLGPHTPRDDEADGEMENYFVPGFDPDDITPLWNIKQKIPLLNAFTTIFRGEPTGVVVRLHVLSEMSLRPTDTITWGVNELRHHFAYLTDTAFDTVLKRLRGGGLIGYDREDNSYTVTPMGLQVNSAVAYFLKSYEDEGLELLTGILYAGDAMGNISAEELAHLLNRLGQLEGELLSAVDSASEEAIIKARGRFDAIWKRIGQGTEIIKRIAQNIDMDRETHKLGQRVANAQSRLARVTSIFQRAMNDIDRQRMHLGNSGVSTSDLNRYLMNGSNKEIMGLIEGAIGIPVQPVLLLSDLLADVAEYEIVERYRPEKEEWRIPELVLSPIEDSPLEEDISHLKEVIGDVKNMSNGDTPLKDIVPKESFEVSSYRLSMLSLVDVSAAHETDGLLSELLNLPVSLHVEDGTEDVMLDGVSCISRGMVKKEEL